MANQKTKKPNFKDDFELLYLRHEYMDTINKASKKLDPSMVAKYAGIVNTTAKIMYSKFKHNFVQVGFDVYDVIAVTNLYMLYYMSLYSMKNNPEFMERMLSKRTKATPESEVERIERNHLISFLRQRLQQFSVVCSRKARNITVDSEKRAFFAATENSRDVAKELVFENPKKYDYRRLTTKEFKEARLRARMAQTTELTDQYGFKIIKMEKANLGISEYDYQLLTEENQGEFYLTPEKSLEKQEDDDRFENIKFQFNSLNQDEKRQVLLNFIQDAERDKHLKSEIKLAKQILEQDCGIML
ncbi:MAG TPA: hypothetical protein DDY18_06125 [Flavobacterium sp.]|jgi:hypothetical protein|nr:hypothetical protein [Flavobacterium sp.]